MAQPEPLPRRSQPWRAFAELGQNEQAIAHFQRALQPDPKNQLARENLEALQKAP